MSLTKISFPSILPAVLSVIISWTPAQTVSCNHVVFRIKVTHRDVQNTQSNHRFTRDKRSLKDFNHVMTEVGIDVMITWLFIHRSEKNNKFKPFRHQTNFRVSENRNRKVYITHNRAIPTIMLICPRYVFHDTLPMVES